MTFDSFYLPLKYAKTVQESEDAGKAFLEQGKFTCFVCGIARHPAFFAGQFICNLCRNQGRSRTFRGLCKRCECTFPTWSKHDLVSCPKCYRSRYGILKSVHRIRRVVGKDMAEGPDNSCDTGLRTWEQLPF